jgi:hypothetical protein
MSNLRFPEPTAAKRAVPAHCKGQHTSNDSMSGGLQLSHAKTNEGKRMNLSIETKLATALGASFVALVLGAIAQTQNDSGTAGANQYALTDNSVSINPSRKDRFARQTPQRFNAQSAFDLKFSERASRQMIRVKSPH